MAPVNLFGTLVGFTSFFQSREREKAKIDSPAFRLHYDFTAGFFFLATALLSLNAMFGKHIQCRGYSDGGKLEKVESGAEAYCWVDGTFTVPDVETSHVGLEGIGHAGKTHDENVCKARTGKSSGKPKWEFYVYDSLKDIVKVTDKTAEERYKKDDKAGKVPLCKRNRSFYQWVSLLFIFQGYLFLIPHNIWKSLEDGKMFSISNGVAKANEQKSEVERSNMVSNIARFVARDNRNGHKKYAYGYFGCQILNLINIVFNFWLLDRFLAGPSGTSESSPFFNLGFRWLASSREEGLLREIFPRVAACEWMVYGTAGGSKIKNYICLLASNIMTEKVFVFLWFWFLILLVTSSLAVLYYALMLFSWSETIRTYFLSYTVRIKVSKLRIINKETEAKETKEKKKIVKYLKDLPATNFFFLYLLAGNIDYRCLQDILEDIASKKITNLN